MKYLILILFSTVVTAQNITIETYVNNFFYWGISNLITVSVDGYDHNSFQLKTDNGSVERIEGNNFSISPKKTGNLKISVYDESNTKIAEKTMHVLDLRFKAILRMSYDEKDNPILKRSRGIKIVVDHPTITLSINPTIKYQILILRGESIIFDIYHESSLFNDEIKKKLLNCQSGDILIIRDITMSSKNDEEIRLSDLSFKI